MKVVFEIESISELEEISEWLARQKIVLQQIAPAKINANALFSSLRRFKIELPSDYRFNRDEANER